MNKQLLSLQNLKTHFFTPEATVKAVDGVSFTIQPGECLGVLGESGCGKSVTALSILRLIPDPPGKILSGSIFLDGVDLLALSKAKMRNIRGNSISMIFQEPMTCLHPLYTIGNQIAEAYITHRNLEQKEAMAQTIEMLKLVRIPAPDKRAHEFPHQLSGGMSQRAMIAMAMACKPKLLIADEPTTALDVTIQAQILDLMASFQEEYGLAIMLITHDLGVIAEISHKVVVMYAGEIVEYMPIDILFAESRHPYTIGLMHSMPKLGAKFQFGKNPLKEIPGIVPDLSRLPPGCIFEARCSHVMEKCRKSRPPLFAIDQNHAAKCWLLDQGNLSKS